MTSECEQGSTPEGAAKPNWAGFPSTSSEFITLIAHYYRAEIARMAGWRDRIDRTSNWAITVVGAMLSVSLSTQPRIMVSFYLRWFSSYSCS
jgi:uncharacterized membrane protein